MTAGLFSHVALSQARCNRLSISVTGNTDQAVSFCTGGNGKWGLLWRPWFLRREFGPFSRSQASQPSFLSLPICATLRLPVGSTLALWPPASGKVFPQLLPLQLCSLSLGPAPMGLWGRWVSGWGQEGKRDEDGVGIQTG